MARFVLLLLLVITGALVIALFFDHRGRRDARFDRLRWAFLHGTPLAGYSRAASLAEVVHPGGMRFRAPASWKIEIVENERTSSAAVPDDVRRVQVELLRLEGPAWGSAIEALKSLATDGERSIEALPNGHALMKSVDPVRESGGLFASYTWRLGRTLTHGGLQMAVFRLRFRVEAADEVIAQSDLATLDRQVRDAAFSDPPSPSVGA